MQAVVGGSVLLLEPFAAAATGLVVAPGTTLLLEAARSEAVRVWAVVGVGRVLDGRLLDALARRAADRAEVVGPGLVERWVGPAGTEAPGEMFVRRACPPAPELLVLAR